MPFYIVRNDITKMQTDAIVNTANPKPLIGAGTDAMIHRAAGPKLLQARQKIGDIPVGQAALTGGFDLDAKYVVHTVGPVWQGGQAGEAAMLRSCYDTALALARKQRCRSVAFPLISAGNYGFPKDEALQIAIQAFSAFLMDHEMDIYLVVFDRSAYQLSEKLFASVQSFIDDHYVDICRSLQLGSEAEEVQRERRIAAAQRMPIPEPSQICEDAVPMAAPQPQTKAAKPTRKSKKSTISLQQMLAREDVGFSGKLLQLIDASGKKDSQVYKRANLSRQHFSKIRNNPAYQPTKSTALALAVALELDLEQTRDLISRAGYALTNSSKFDLIVMYFIQQQNFDIMQINMTLYEFDQNLLGS